MLYNNNVRKTNDKNRKGKTQTLEKAASEK